MKAAIVFLIGLIVPMYCSAVSEYPTMPKLKNGEKWRFGYYEGGDYHNYQKHLIETIKALMKLGWIEESDIPPQEGSQTKQLWNWLATEAKSRYIQFLPNGYYSAEWNKALREKMAADIIHRLNTAKDIDFMIAMGTWAGQDLANNRHKTPMTVMSCSDPLASGIIKAVDDSGYDHVHARMDPYRFERQVWVFHKILNFKKLGMAYEDTVAGRSYSAIDRVRKVGASCGFDIVSCYTIDHTTDRDAVEKSIIDCFQTLVKTSDAIYVTVQSGVNPKMIPKLAKIANDHRIPTFSQAGKDEVSMGFLMSISPISFQYAGQFFADAIAKIGNGAVPRHLPMYFKEPYQWDFNFETAKLIGLDISSLNLEIDYFTMPDF